jgi:hypothetical protein
MSVFGDRPAFAEAYDSADEEGDNVEEMANNIEELAEAAQEPLVGEDDEDIIMRNYLLKHCHDTNIRLDFKDDATIVQILKLKGDKLAATFNYVLHQVKENETRGLTDLIVDNIANQLYNIDHDKEAHEKIMKDTKLRSLVHSKLGNFEYIPEWLQLGGYIASYVMKALRNRRAKQAAGKSGTLPNATQPNSGARF